MKFNAFIATHSMRPRKQTQDSPVTAGAPKVPTSAVNISKTELQDLGGRMGWDATKELSMRDLHNMGSAEYRFHELLNPNFQAAFDRAENKRVSDKNIAEWRIRKMWENGTPEEINAGLAEVKKFVTAYPQFIGANEQNRKALVNWLVSMNLPCTYDNLVAGFRDLATSGKLTLRDGDTELSGQNLVNSPRLRVLLEPQSRPLPADESADAYYAAHPELHPGKPYLIRQREVQKEHTQKFFQQAANATTKGSVLSVTDYPVEQNGVAPMPDKSSFRIKVKSMSASELLQRCNDDPAFRKALDELER